MCRLMGDINDWLFKLDCDTTSPSILFLIFFLLNLKRFEKLYYIVGESKYYFDC